MNCPASSRGPTPHHSLPCLTDTIIVPLATWIYILALALTILVHFATRNRRHAPSAPLFSHASEPPSSPTSSSGPSPLTQGRRATSVLRIVAVIYYVLVLALVAMVTIEIARLATAGLGVRQLPWTYCGIVLAVLVRWLAGAPSRARGTRNVRWVTAGWWLLLAVVFAVGTGVSVDEMHEGDTVDRAEYPLADEVTDRAVVVGLAVVLAVCDVVAIVKGGWRRRRSLI